MTSKLYNITLITVPVASLIGVYFLSKLYRNCRNKILGVPFVEGGLPLLGQVFVMLKGSPWDIMTDWMLKYGMNYRFHLFGSDALVVADPALLKVILSTKMSVFKKDLAWTYKPFLALLGSGLVTADGHNWRRQRTLLSHTLRIDILDDIPNMAYRAIQRLKLKLDQIKNNNIVIEMGEEFRHLTLQVVAEAILSLDPIESDNTFANMYLPIVTEGNYRTWSPQRMYLPTFSWFKFRNDVQRLDNYVTKLILKRWEKRQQESKNIQSGDRRKQDILDIVLSAIKPEDWNTSTIKQIRDEVKTFILAGHETSASMMTWALYELTQNKQLMDRARSEAREVFGINVVTPTSLERLIINPPSLDALSGLTFITNCLKEALRKYSVVPSVVRVASEPVQHENIFIPQGATVMLNLQGVHHNPSFWPNPMEYNPDRFDKELEPFTFLPFIDGPRMCLGQYLSLLETKIVIALLILSYEFKVTNADAGQKHPFMVPIIPKSGHFMKIKQLSQTLK